MVNGHVIFLVYSKFSNSVFNICQRVIFFVFSSQYSWVWWWIDKGGMVKYISFVIIINSMQYVRFIFSKKENISNNWILFITNINIHNTRHQYNFFRCDEIVFSFSLYSLKKWNPLHMWATWQVARNYAFMSVYVCSCRGNFSQKHIWLHKFHILLFSGRLIRNTLNSSHTLLSASFR